MKNTFIKRVLIAIIVLFVGLNGFAQGTTAKKPIIKNKVTNPNYDPNKGLFGKPKEEKVIKRTRNEPLIKNRKYEPIIKKNK